MPDSLGIGDDRRARLITKSGLIFIGASMDSRVRAIDLKTGKVLWQALVEAPAVAMPAVYDLQGQGIRGLRRRRQLDPASPR